MSVLSKWVRRAKAANQIRKLVKEAELDAPGVVQEIEAMQTYYDHDKEQFFKVNDLGKSSQKAGVEAGETLVAAAAASLAAWLSAKAGLDVPAEAIIVVGTVLLKFAAKFLRDSMKQRPAK